MEEKVHYLGPVDQEVRNTEQETFLDQHITMDQLLRDAPVVTATQMLGQDGNNRSGEVWLLVLQTPFSA